MVLLRICKKPIYYFHHIMNNKCPLNKEKHCNDYFKTLTCNSCWRCSCCSVTIWCSNRCWIWNAIAKLSFDNCHLSCDYCATWKKLLKECELVKLTNKCQSGNCHTYSAVKKYLSPSWFLSFLHITFCHT